MSERRPCSACGGSNGADAAFCGQCFAPLAGARAQSTAHPPLGSSSMGGGGASPALNPPPQRHPSGGMPLITAGNSWVLRLVIVLVSFAVGWAGVGVVLNRPRTVEAQDGSFTVTHSRYWDPVDLSGLPPLPGFSPDLAIENDHSAVFIMHAPAPPGAEQQLQQTFNTAALERILAASPWPGKLQRSTLSGTTEVGGEPAAIEAKAKVDFEGVRGQLDLLIAFSPDGGNVVLITHGCATERCSDSNAEFEDLLSSIEFAAAPGTAR